MFYALILISQSIIKCDKSWENICVIAWKRRHEDIISWFPPSAHYSTSQTNVWPMICKIVASNQKVCAKPFVVNNTQQYSSWPQSQKRCGISVNFRFVWTEVVVNEIANNESENESDTRRQTKSYLNENWFRILSELNVKINKRSNEVKTKTIAIKMITTVLKWFGDPVNDCYCNALSNRFSMLSGVKAKMKWLHNESNLQSSTLWRRIALKSTGASNMNVGKRCFKFRNCEIVFHWVWRSGDIKVTDIIPKPIFTVLI